jgi:hypothetical protein
MVLLWSLGMMFYSHDANSTISDTDKDPFTWHTEESFHAHVLAIQQHGFCEIHRKTFGIVRQMAQTTLFI